ncbi:MAG: alpha/beta fold hydrolase [Deltaproteobacteria bacterium]|nr:alpha/beta fold hydrolase [Deltaproteobacteria bacterium]
MSGPASPFDFPGDDRGILLLHGLTGSPYDMRVIGWQLAAQGFSVAAPVMAGHGGSVDDLARVRWQDWLAGAGVALDRLKARCRRVMVVGQSMGGLCALTLAATRDDIDAVASLAAPLWLEGLSARVARWVAPGGWLHGRVQVLPKIGGSDVSVKAERRTGHGLPRIPAPSLVELGGLMAEAERLLPAIRAPLLVLHGARDGTAPVACAAHLAERGRAARVRILPRSQHVLTLDVERLAVMTELARFARAHL